MHRTSMMKKKRRRKELMSRLKEIENEIELWAQSPGVKNEQGSSKEDQHLNAYAHAYASAVINYFEFPGYHSFVG